METYFGWCASSNTRPPTAGEASGALAARARSRSGALPHTSGSRTFAEATSLGPPTRLCGCTPSRQLEPLALRSAVEAPCHKFGADTMKCCLKPPLTAPPSGGAARSVARWQEGPALADICCGRSVDFAPRAGPERTHYAVSHVAPAVDLPTRRVYAAGHCRPAEARGGRGGKAEWTRPATIAAGASCRRAAAPPLFLRPVALPPPTRETRRRRAEAAARRPPPAARRRLPAAARPPSRLPGASGDPALARPLCEAAPPRHLQQAHDGGRRERQARRGARR